MIQGQFPEHHVFEPSLISIALQKPTGPNLSHLIFKTEDLNVLLKTPDPLTQYASLRGLLHTCGQHVHPSTYTPRFLDMSSYKKSKVSTCMIMIKKKHLWSVMHPNPAWGFGVLESQKEKTKMLFRSRITKSVKEVIGPRDYVGMPRRITVGKSTMLTRMGKLDGVQLRSTPSPPLYEARLDSSQEDPTRHSSKMGEGIRSLESLGGERSTLILRQPEDSKAPG
ncbi:hypothetical protein FRC00_003670 [Tulasnella sp. 408]|nr:hypothetical protein FRC00_003670 [Tulasnella sp. 408]